MIDVRNPVIVCGSGPSLLKVNPWLPGLPICAVSTAIKTLYQLGNPKPTYWALVDSLNVAHKPEGQEAAEDADIKKIVPSTRRPQFKHYPNVEYVLRHTKHATFLDDSPGLSRTQNRSMLFAIQWLIKFAKHDCLIFAGCDLKCPGGKAYAHKGKQRTKVAAKDGQHRAEFRHLSDWLPIARDYGCTWLCWSPGSPLEGIMEPWSGRIWKTPDARSEPTTPILSSPPDCPAGHH